MGVVFLEVMNDPSAKYECRNCCAYLTNELQIINRHFQSGNGRAYLFNKVVNITSGKKERRNMLSGMHYVRDVYCKSCNEKVGWMYEFAYPKDQQFKEAKTILELSQLNKIGYNGDT